MKKNEKHGLIAIVVLAILFVGAMQYGMLKQIGIPPLSYTPSTGGNNNGNGGNTPTNTDYANGIGKYQLDFKAANTATSAALSVATDLNLWAMHYVNGQYTPEGSMFTTSSTCYFTATAADNGFMWILVKPYTTTYYVDYQSILSKEGLPGYVVGVQYIQDPLGDGHKDFLFQFNLKNQPVPAAGSYPVLSFQAWGIGYDSSFTGLSTYVGAAAAGNFSGIGIISVPKYYETDISFSAVDLGVAVYKVEVIFGNSTRTVTDQTKATITSLSFPGAGTISGDSFSQIFTNQDIRYDYTISTSLYGADYISLGPTANNKFPVNIQLQLTLSANDIVPLTINVFYLDTAGVGHSKTSEVGLYASAAMP